MIHSRIEKLKSAMRAQDIDLALITDDDSIYYFSGYYDFLHMEFGRPTILAIPIDGESFLITPSIDYNSALDLAEVDHIQPWNDGLGSEWRTCLTTTFQHSKQVGYEVNRMLALVKDYLFSLQSKNILVDISPLISRIRSIKSAQELQLARHAGAVANAMMNAGRAAIAHDVPEYEIALATNQAGTRKAAELLQKYYKNPSMSPNTHFLQIMASGNQITRTHHRASTRRMQNGEAVFLCFCGMTNFHKFKLGFDRTFWIEYIEDKHQQNIYQVAVDSQRAALSLLKAGAVAEDIHAAYAEVIQNAGYAYPFRCGRGTGFSFLESPQLVFGDKTVLQPNMVLAVDGSVSTENFRAQVGDSFIVTETGYEALTEHPKSIQDIIIYR